MPVEKSIDTLLPSVRKISRIFFTSVISGTPMRRKGWSVSRVAQRMGRTAFLLADGVISPRNGTPPCTIRFDMFGRGSWKKRGDNHATARRAQVVYVANFSRR